VKKLTAVAGVVLISVAIATCLLFGTLGWLMVGIGLMTDCTNYYGCTETGCAPCATAGRWINAGAIGQWILIGVGVGVAAWARRPQRRSALAIGGAALLVASLVIMFGATWRAQESYCQPGTAGYGRSSCSTR
jgi:hypothetical protein